MSPLTPSSDDIIFALESLGFNIRDECDEYTIMSDGIYTVKVFRHPDEEQMKKLRRGLSDILFDYENKVNALIGSESYSKSNLNQEFDSRDRLFRIRSWLN